MSTALTQIFPDRTDLKASAGAEKIVEQSMESFFKVFNASPGGMCLVDNSLILEINPTLKRKSSRACSSRNCSCLYRTILRKSRK